jgi:uncharacterized protein
MTGNLADHLVAEQPQKLLTRRKFLIRSSLAVAGLGLYSAEVARHEISVVTRTIGIENLPDAFHNFRIVQISDIHYASFTEPFFLRRVIQHVNSLAADLVILTGDYISFGPYPTSWVLRMMQHCSELLHAIECPQRFAVMGNHDSSLGSDVIRPILANVSIPLLLDEHYPIERAGQRLWLCGTLDPVSHFPDLNAAIPEKPDGPVLLMCHGPDYADQVIAHPRGHLVDVMFSGHSHGGQVRLPLLPPLHLPDGGRKYYEGLYRFNRLQLYVNRGIGAVGVPFRLNCPPEITLFTLQKS